MRFIWGDYERVEEVVELSITPIWESSHGDEDIPNMLAVTIGFATKDGFTFDYGGEYKLDGTRETYEASMTNFRQIVKDAAIKGYFFETQFKDNFEFW